LSVSLRRYSGKEKELKASRSVAQVFSFPKTKEGNTAVFSFENKEGKGTESHP
jgi:hypothetical protein